MKGFLKFIRKSTKSNNCKHPPLLILRARLKATADPLSKEVLSSSFAIDSVNDYIYTQIWI